MGLGVFCVHKPGFLMPGHIRTYMYIAYSLATYIYTQYRILLCYSYVATYICT